MSTQTLTQTQTPVQNIDKSNCTRRLVLWNNHNTFRTLFQQLLDPSLDPQKRLELKNQLIKEICIHDNVEQQLVHPLYRKFKGEKSEREIIGEEDSLALKLAYFDKMDVNDPQFIQTVSDLFNMIKSHMSHEENSEFPVIESELDEESMNNLNSTIENIKGTVPTRPHKIKSTTQNPILAPVVAFFDKIRDKGRSYPQQESTYPQQ